MKVTCEKCNAQYDVDESRIPPDGLTMKCPKCMTSFNVKPKDTEVAAAKPAQSKKEKKRFFIRRKSGKIFGPFLEKAVTTMLEQHKLSDADKISLDKETWHAMDTFPAVPSGEEAAAAEELAKEDPSEEILMPIPLEGGEDKASEEAVKEDDGEEGEEKKESVEVVVEIAENEKKTKEVDISGDTILGMGGEGKLEGLDSGAPAAWPAEVDLDEIPGGQTIEDAPELPAPKEEAPELPAPVREGAGGGDPDLDLSGLPAPKEDIPDLPAPKQELPDLLAPKGDVVDLPAPKDDLSDLPEPRDGLSGLPQPKDGLSDLPEPRDGVTDLPEPKGLKGFFEYGQVDLADEEGITELDALPVPAGIEVGGEPGVDLPSPRSLDTGEQKPSVEDVSAAIKKITEEEGEQEVVRFEPPPESPERVVTPPVSAEVPSQAAKDDALESKAAARLKLMRKRRMVAGGVGGFILLGLILGFFTPFGFFGLHYITGGYSEEKQAREMVEKAQKSLGQDTYALYQQVITDSRGASEVLDGELDPLILQIQAMCSKIIRFGKDNELLEKSVEVKKALTAMVTEPLSGKAVADGLVFAASGNWAAAPVSFQEAVKLDEKNAMAWIYLGWTQQRALKFKEADHSYSKALLAQNGLAVAYFGKAQVAVATNKPDVALSLLDKTLKANAKHTGAMLVKSSLLRTAGKRKEAAQTLQQLVRAGKQASKGEMSTGQYELGQLALEDGDTNEARKRFQQAIKINPRSPMAHVGMGQIYFLSKYYKKALDLFRKAKSFDKKSIKAGIWIARTLLAMEKPLDGKEALDGVKRYAGNSPEFAFYAGLVEVALNNLDEANKLYEKAIKLRPTYFDPYLYLSRLHLLKKNTKAAHQVLDRADKKMPKSSKVRNAQGEIFLATGLFLKAKGLFEESLKLNPKSNTAKFNLGNAYYRLKKYPEAVEQYTALKKRDKNYPGLSAQLGKLYMDLKKYKEAAAEYTQALQVDKPKLKLRLAAARAFTKAGNFDRALKQAEKALEENSSLAAARAIRAEALLAKDRTGDALVEIRQAITREQKAEYYIIEGKIYEALSRRALDAIDSYGKALKLDPNNLEIKMRRAILLVKVGRVKDGLLALRKVVDERPRNAEPWLYIGDAYIALGYEDRAFTAYIKAATLDSKLGLAHFKLGQMYLDKRQFTSALKRMELALQHSKKDVSWRGRALFLAGEAAQHCKQRQKAIKYYEAFMKMPPEQSSAVMRQEVIKRMTALGKPPPKEEIP